MPARVSARPGLFMTMTDIAELAGKPRPLISTWRRRYPDSFPAEVGGDEAVPRRWPAPAVLVCAR